MNVQETTKELIPEVGKTYFAIHKDHNKYTGNTVPITKVKCEGGSFHKDTWEFRTNIRFPNNVIASVSNYLLFSTIDEAVKHLQEYYRNK